MLYRTLALLALSLGAVSAVPHELHAGRPAARRLGARAARVAKLQAVSPGATQEACVLLEDDAGIEGASPKRQRIVSEKNFPVTETRVRPCVGPRAGDTFVI